MHLGTIPTENQRKYCRSPPVHYKQSTAATHSCRATATSFENPPWGNRGVTCDNEQKGRSTMTERGSGQTVVSPQDDVSEVNGQFSRMTSRAKRSTGDLFVLYFIFIYAIHTYPFEHTLEQKAAFNSP